MVPVAARSVVDLAGRTVELPERVERIACLEVLCYPRLFMLGADDRIVQLYQTAAPWMAVTNPKVRQIPAFQGEPSLEELLARRTQVAFFSYNTRQTQERLTAAGIVALVSQPGSRALEEREGFLAANKAMVRLFGQVLGGEAERRAEEWCAYFDQRVAYVSERVAAIPPGQRLRLYYVRGPQVLSTQGRAGYTTGFGLLAGAIMVVRETPLAGRGLISPEDLLRWNPQVMLVGRQYPLSLVLEDARWRELEAVRHQRVRSTPEGVFYWDGGPEGVLLMQFIARELYPEHFPDLDLAAEIKAYYARFYRYPLSDDEVAKLLQGQGPDGRRFNPMNN